MRRPNKLEQFNDDFYAVTFYSIIWHYDYLRPEIMGLKKKHKKDKRTGQLMVVGEGEMAKNFMSCFFIFFIQVVLSSYLLAYFFKQWDKTSREFVGFDVLVTRLLCAIVMHLQIESEVHQAIMMLKFTLYRVPKWESRLPMLLIAIMQLLGAVFTEGVNLFLICTLSDLKEIIINLIAFGAISEIDDFYAKSQRNSFLRFLVTETRLNFQSIGNRKFDDLAINRLLPSKVCYHVLYKLIKMLYQAVYFYFVPFFVVLLSFVIYLR